MMSDDAVEYLLFVTNLPVDSQIENAATETTEI